MIYLTQYQDVNRIEENDAFQGINTLKQKKIETYKQSRVKR